MVNKSYDTYYRLKFHLKTLAKEPTPLAHFVGLM